MSKKTLFEVLEKNPKFESTLDFSHSEGALAANIYFTFQNHYLFSMIRHYQHIFVYDLEEAKTSLEWEDLESIHQFSRTWVNDPFKVPRSFRFWIPNIVSVFIVDQEVPESTLRGVKKSPISFIGGEAHQIIILDTKQERMLARPKPRKNEAIRQGLNLGTQMAKVLFSP